MDEHQESIFTGRLLPKAESIAKLGFPKSAEKVEKFASHLYEIYPAEFDRILQETRRYIYVLCGTQGSENLREEATGLAIKEQREIDGLVDPVTAETAAAYKDRSARWRSYIALRDLVISGITHDHKRHLFGYLAAKFRSEPNPERVPEIFLPEEGRDKRGIDNDTPLDELLDIIAYTDSLSPEELESNLDIATIRQATHAQLIRALVSTDAHFIEKGSRFFKYRHYKSILENMHGALSEGKIGGKSAGILVAYAALEDPDPEFDKAFLEQLNSENIKIKKTELDQLLGNYLEQNESTHIGSIVFQSIIKHNPSLSALSREKYRCKSPGVTRDDLQAEYEKNHAKVMAAEFPGHILRQLQRVFDKLQGQPLVIRSSAELEDRFGAAFAGKYDSVYVSGEDFDEFISAIKQVYASVFNPDVMLYRKEHGLLDENEEMGILIQKMNGAKHGDYYYPAFAGVGMSLGLQTSGPDPSKGEMCLVMGLGETAVDSGGRVILFDKPNENPNMGKARASQKTIVVMQNGKKRNLTINELIQDGSKNYPTETIKHTVSKREQGGFTDLADAILSPSDTFAITFDQLVNKEWKSNCCCTLPILVRYIVKKLEHKLGHKVDVEFTAEPHTEGTGFDAKTTMKIRVVQCRPQNVPEELTPSQMPKEVPQERVAFESKTNLGSGHAENIEHLLYIDPEVKNHLPANKYTELANYLGRINERLGKRSYYILTPGRFGSNAESLQGIPARYSHFKNAAGFTEMKGSLWSADPSFGTHFFQDVVEAGQLTFSLENEDPSAMNMAFIQNAPNSIDALGLDIPAEFKPWLKLINIEDAYNAHIGAAEDSAKKQWRLHVAQDNTRGKGNNIAKAYIAEKDKDIPQKVT